MDYVYSDLIDAARSWGTGAREAGWLAPLDLEVLESLDDRSPASLFSGEPKRPLVVAFFGGTGVGKSTLLNRLAGREIARTGVVRPTSRGITVFLHQGLHISHLPDEFPVEKVKVATHDDDRRKEIMWVDMPDIDSTEHSNHEIVLEWLPHIDVVVYVVSPERYRDDRGWRLLLSQGQRHAWMFVFNQWDRGQPVQYEDFKRQLAKAGFLDPIILRTACVREGAEEIEEDFATLDATLEALADANAVKQLELRDVRLRLSEIADALRRCLARLAPGDAFDALASRWHGHWEAAVESLEKGLDWPVQHIAKAYVSDELRLFGGSRKIEEGEKAAKGNPVLGMWDDWVQTRIDDALEQLVIEGDAGGIPTGPLKSLVLSESKVAKKKILVRVEQSVRESLANPGNALQRLFLRIAGLCSTLLPLAAIGWVSYLAFQSYYTSSQTGQPFLGVDFAVHSGLLIVISWLLPYFIYRKLRPSSEKAALRGLKRGLAAGFSALEADVMAGILDRRHQRDELVTAAQKLILRCEAPPEPAAESAADLSVLARMLVESRQQEKADA